MIAVKPYTREQVTTKRGSPTLTTKKESNPNLKWLVIDAYKEALTTYKLPHPISPPVLFFSTQMFYTAKKLTYHKTLPNSLKGEWKSTTIT